MPTTTASSVVIPLKKCRRRLPNELLSELVDWLPMAQFHGDTMAPRPQFGASQMCKLQLQGRMRNVALVTYLDRARHKYQKAELARVMSDLQKIYDKCTPEQKERIQSATDAADAAEKARRATIRDIAAELGLDLGDSAEHEEEVTGVAGKEDRTIPAAEGQDEHRVALERDEGMPNRGDTRKQKHGEAEQSREDEPSPALKRTKLDVANQKHLLQQPQGAVEVRHQADEDSEDTLLPQRVAVEVRGQPEERREEEALPLSQDPPPVLTPQPGENVLTGPEQEAIQAAMSQIRVKMDRLRSEKHGRRNITTNLHLSELIEFFHTEKVLFAENVLNNAVIKRALEQCSTDLDSQNMLLSWLILEIALCTRTHGGVETNRIHVPCWGFIEVQLEKLRDFHQTKHPQEATTLANHALPMCEFFLKVFCHTLNNERFNEEEMDAIFAIFLFNLKPGPDQQNHAQHSQNVSTVPSSSSRHGTAPLSLAIRLSNIFLLLTSLFRLVTWLKEYFIELQISR